MKKYRLWMYIGIASAFSLPMTLANSSPARSAPATRTEVNAKHYPLISSISDIKGWRVSVRNISGSAKGAPGCPPLPVPRVGYRTNVAYYYGGRSTHSNANTARVYTGRIIGGSSGLAAQRQYYEGYIRYQLFGGCRDTAGKSRYWVAVAPAGGVANNYLTRQLITVYLYRGGGGGTAYVRTGPWTVGGWCGVRESSTLYDPRIRPCVAWVDGVY